MKNEGIWCEEFQDLIYGNKTYLFEANLKNVWDFLL